MAGVFVYHNCFVKLFFMSYCVTIMGDVYSMAFSVTAIDCAGAKNERLVASRKVGSQTGSTLLMGGRLRHLVYHFHGSAPPHPFFYICGPQIISLYQ